LRAGKFSARRSSEDVFLRAFADIQRILIESIRLKPARAGRVKEAK